MKILRPALLTAGIAFIAAQFIGAIANNRINAAGGVLSWKISDYMFYWHIADPTFWMYALTGLAIVAAALWQRRTATPNKQPFHPAAPAPAQSFFSMGALALIMYLTVDLCLGSVGFDPFTTPFVIVCIALLLVAVWRIPPGRIVRIVDTVGAHRAWPLVVAVGATVLTLYSQRDIFRGLSIITDT